jgi:predicted dehydrogenase
MTRLGFVGAGFMGQLAHLRSYAAVADCQLVALAESRPELARRVAARYGIDRIYPDYQAMLEAESLDGVVATVPFNQHARLLPGLYEGCRHVFTEKALAVKPETGRRLEQAARSAGCVHMVGYHKRADPAVSWAIERIERWRTSGEAGKIRYVRIAMPPGDWIAGEDSEYLRGDEPSVKRDGEAPPVEFDSEVGEAYVSFVNYYIHQVNLLAYLLGERYRVSHADRSGVLLVAESETGIPGLIEMSPYRTATDWQEEALVAFEHGYVRVGLPPPLCRNRAGHVEAYLDRRGGTQAGREIPTLPHIGAMAAQARWFVRVCRDEIAPLCSVAESVEDLAVAYDYVVKRYSPGPAER